MASMYRNTNLEEIEVDSFLGIEFLKYQTLIQKIVFIGGFVCAGSILIICSLVFHLGTMVSLLVSFPLLLVAIAFGCNYNQDLSLIKYLILLMREPVIKLPYRSTEDINYIRMKAKEFSSEAEVSDDEGSEEEHQKTLKRFIIGIIAFVVFLAAMLILIFVFKDDGVGIHHTIS
jgi:hypothetical protein